MLIDFGKLIGGPDEGDGVVGGLLGFLGLGALLGGAGAAEGLGGSAGVAEASAGWASKTEGFFAGAGHAGAGASEGVFARIFHNFTATDAIFWGDFFKRGNQKASAAWQSLNQTAKEVAISHNFILQQLKKHDLTDLGTEYEKLGLDLPSEDLLKKTYRALAPKLHPDTNKFSDNLMAFLNSAKEALSDSNKRREYENLLKGDRTQLEEIFTKFGETEVNWNEAYEAAVKAEAGEVGRILTARAGAEAENAARLSNSKTKLIFAGAALVATGAYIGIKMWKKQHPKHPHNQHLMGEIPFPVLHTQQVSNEKNHEPNGIDANRLSAARL
jgi:hypothetical protein